MSQLHPALQRDSACPVHFLWDGRGRGRAMVRAGFLGLVGAGALYAASRTFGVDVFTTAGAVVAAGAGVVYVVGQAISFLRPARRVRA